MLIKQEKAAPKKKLPTVKGDRRQSDSALFERKKPSEVSSRRLAGAQRSAQARQQKRRDAH